MNKLYFKLISILLIITVSYLFFHVQRAHAFFIPAIIGAIVGAVSAAVGTIAGAIGGIVAVIAGSVGIAMVVGALATGIGIVVASFLCGSPFVGGEYTGDFYTSGCGGGFRINISGADSGSCDFQGHIAFVNPNMNKGWVVTQSTDYYLQSSGSGGQYSQCDPNQQPYYGDCYEVVASPDQRYSDGPVAASKDILGNPIESSPGCTIQDPNGSYVAHPQYIIDAGAGWGKFGYAEWGESTGPTICDKIKTKKTCSYSDTANDDASKQVAIYRFTLPANADNTTLVYWLFDLESKVGSGLVNLPTIIDYSDPNSWNYYSYGTTPTSNYFSGYFGNAASYDSNIIATVPYSQICQENVCEFIDSSVPLDSYVVYAAKILGGFNDATQASFDLYGGYSPNTSDVTWTNSVGCDVKQNKFLNTGGGSPTLFPPPSFLLTTRRHQPNTANAAQAQWNQFNGSPNQKAFVGPLKSSACPTSTLPTVDLTTNLSFTLPNPIVLNWTSANASSCAATAGDWSGNKTTGGQEELLKPLGNYTFTLTCTNPNGSASDTANTSVINALLQGPQCDFVANPSSIIPPQTSTLSWECINANSCEIDQSIGSVNPVSGNTEVSPTETTTYNLNCQGAGGGTSASFPVTVNVGFSSWLREILPR